MQNLNENESYTYHYSHKTGKVEKCGAKSLATCPYKNLFHSNNKYIIDNYVDKENEEYSKLNSFQRDFFLRNITDKTFPFSPTLSTESIYEGHKITSQVLKYLGLTEDQIQSLKLNKALFITPKTDTSIQQAFSIFHVRTRIDQELKDAWMKGAIGSRYKGIGQPYHYYDYLPYTQYGNARLTLELDQPVNVEGINGEKSYTVRDVWETWVKLKKDRSEMFEVEKNGNTFYVYSSYDFYANNRW